MRAVVCAPSPGSQQGTPMSKTIIAKFFLAVLFLCSLVSAGTVTAATVPPTMTNDDYFLYLPKNAATRGPLQVLVTVHGMGGDGPSFCQNLINRADADGFAIIAPTFQYHDYKVTANVTADDSAMLPHLKQIIDQLPERTGLTFKGKVILYGFSRGAQIVHRFAEFYPEQVLAVALFSAGSYTLPQTAMTTAGVPQNMAFPFGVADLSQYGSKDAFNSLAFRQIHFFVGVGGSDTNPGDTPRDWDITEGTTRVARAQTFADTLTRMNMAASFTMFPDVGHEVTPDMRATAMTFLEQQSAGYGNGNFSFALPFAR